MCSKPLNKEEHLLVRDLRSDNREYFFKYSNVTDWDWKAIIVCIQEKYCYAESHFPKREISSYPTLPCYRRCPMFYYWNLSNKSIITETCDAIFTSFQRMNNPDSPSNFNEWKSVTQEFKSKWNFPHAAAVLVGNYVVMQPPHNSGSAYFNYKKT